MFVRGHLVADLVVFFINHNYIISFPTIKFTEYEG